MSDELREMIKEQYRRNTLEEKRNRERGDVEGEAHYCGKAAAYTEMLTMLVEREETIHTLRNRSAEMLGEALE